MPIQNGKYVSPTWKNNAPPPLNASELNAMGQTLQQASNNYQRDEILTDTTKTAYGLENTATPDDVFNQIHTEIENTKWELVYSKTTAGTDTYTLPSGYTKFLIFGIGGGGGGRVNKAYLTSGTRRSEGNGGGSGNIDYAVITSTAKLNIVVGSGSVASTNSALNDDVSGGGGSSTSVKSSSNQLILAQGGAGGSDNMYANGGQPAIMYEERQNINGYCSDFSKFGSSVSSYGVLAYLQQQFPNVIPNLVPGGWVSAIHKDGDDGWQTSKQSVRYGPSGVLTRSSSYSPPSSSIRAMVIGQGGPGVICYYDTTDSNTLTGFPGADGAVYIFGGKS